MAHKHTCWFSGRILSTYARGSEVFMCSMAANRSCSCLPSLRHSIHSHPSHNNPEAPCRIVTHEPRSTARALHHMSHARSTAAATRRRGEGKVATYLHGSRRSTAAHTCSSCTCTTWKGPASPCFLPRNRPHSHPPALGSWGPPPVPRRGHSSPTIVSESPCWRSFR